MVVLYFDLQLLIKNVAFPGRAGSTRERGINWDEHMKDTSGNALVGTAIVNRVAKILDSGVYTNKPMYTIILKPKYIRNIRDYNKKAKNQGKDSYSDFTVTSSSYGSSYNEYLGYQCRQNGTYIYCASLFLEHLRTYSIDDEDGYTRLLSGKCMNSGVATRLALYFSSR